LACYPSEKPEKDIKELQKTKGIVRTIIINYKAYKNVASTVPFMSIIVDWLD